MKKNTLLSTVLALFTVVSAEAQIPSNAAAHYPLDGNLLDISGNDLHGTAVNGPEAFLSGIIGDAATLPGTPDYHLGIPTFPPGSHSFTVSAWFRIDDPNDLYLGYLAPIFTYQTGDFSDGFQLSVTRSAGRYGVLFATSASNSHKLFFEPTTLFGDWHHVAALLDRNSGQAELYFDGDLVASSSNIPSSGYTSAKGFIGSYDYGSARNGATRFVTPIMDIDDVLLYHRALSASEIAGVFQVAMDSDGDGIADLQDACPDSDLSPTIPILGRDSGVANSLLEDGCTLADEFAGACELANDHLQLNSDGTTRQRNFGNVPPRILNHLVGLLCRKNIITLAHIYRKSGLLTRSEERAIRRAAILAHR